MSELTEDALVRYLDVREPMYVARLRELVDINSGLDNPAGRLACVEKLHARYTALGFACERVARPGDMVHLVARRPAAPQFADIAPRLLVLGHFDTVFDSTSGFLSFQHAGDWSHGPGVADMKGGLVVAQAALEALAAQGVLDRIDVVAVHNGDEEVQSPTSRDLIEAAARDRTLALDFEMGRKGGGIVRGRAGVGRYFVTVRGKAAHAGTNHGDGASAIVALAKKVLDFEALTDLAAGTTLNVGKISGGAKRNIVPDDARCELDVRVRTTEAGEAIDAAVRAIVAREDLPGTHAEAMGGIGRPPWVESAGTSALVRHFQTVARSFDLTLAAETTGGGSDANFTASLGIPSIDGLGPVGEKAHTHEERILTHTLVERAKLVAVALARLAFEVCV